MITRDAIGFRGRIGWSQSLDGREPMKRITRMLQMLETPDLDHEQAMEDLQRAFFEKPKAQNDNERDDKSDGAE